MHFLIDSIANCPTGYTGYLLASFWYLVPNFVIGPPIHAMTFLNKWSEANLAQHDAFHRLLSTRTLRVIAFSRTVQLERVLRISLIFTN